MARLRGTALRVILISAGVIVAFTLGIAAGGAGSKTNTGASKPAPTVTKTLMTPGPVITEDKPGPTVTKTIRIKPPGPKAVMTADGVYVVGADIQPGIYHTSGAVGGAGGNCYVALLASTNTSDIIDNNNVTGPDTVTVGSGVRAMETEGCQPWHKVG